MSYSFYEEKAKEIRSNILKLVYEGNCGHTGGSLSETDLMVALYYDVMTYRVEEPNWPLRDRFVLSKGHAVECLYCILSDIGFISREELKTYGKFGTRLIGHPNNKINKIANRQAICDTLIELAETDKTIMVLCSDSRGSASMKPFADKYPDQFVETGIAEQNIVGIAAGLASCGKKPIVASPAAFLSARAAEQVKLIAIFGDLYRRGAWRNEW